jgi:hypothetical protein
VARRLSQLIEIANREAPFTISAATFDHHNARAATAAGQPQGRPIWAPAAIPDKGIISFPRRQSRLRTSRRRRFSVEAARAPLIEADRRRPHHGGKGRADYE